MFNKSGWLIVNICFSCALYIYIHSWISSRFCHGGTPSHPVVTGCFNTTCHGPWLGGLGVPPWLWKSPCFYHQKDRNVDLLEWLSIDPLMNYLLSIHMGSDFEGIPSKYRVFGRENYDKPVDLYRVPCV
jgi:hypothetical protein